MDIEYDPSDHNYHKVGGVTLAKKPVLLTDILTQVQNQQMSIEAASHWVAEKIQAIKESAYNDGYTSSARQHCPYVPNFVEIDREDFVCKTSHYALFDDDFDPDDESNILY